MQISEQKKRAHRMIEKRGARRSVFRSLSLLALAASALAGLDAVFAREAPPPSGDLKLSYAMPEAKGERIPYRVYLPKGWRPHGHWPLVVLLHGYAGTADTTFNDAGGLLQTLADKHGFVLVSPNGYNGMADYGANLPLPSALSRLGKPLTMSPEAESKLAEQDVLHVLKRTIRDYHIDQRRIFLMGNSMGMTGVLHFAATMPRRWCGISPSDGPPWPNYPIERLKPIKGAMFVHGENDDIARLVDTEGLAARAKALGFNSVMRVVPGGSHAGAWVRVLPETFDFFAGLDCRGR